MDRNVNLNYTDLMKIKFSLFILSFLFSQLFTAQVIYIDNSSKDVSYDSSLFSVSGKASETFKPISVENIKLLPSLFLERYNLNRKYLLSFDNDKLLQNFYYEAGISKTGHISLNKDENIGDFYWGWESPSCQLRGHFLGHWLSAAAYMYAETKDVEIKSKADRIVQELALCQKMNGGQWVGSIPEKYFDLMASGQQIWSPQYTIHKTLMGLYDMYLLTGSEQSLEVLDNFADWFHQWTQKQIADNNAQAIYRGEACGMLEIWAELYGLTKKQKYKDLMECYGNPYIFQALIKGDDVLSNDHANASIPWSHGSAKVYEVTGNPYWRNITFAFWKNAVLDRGHFCTGGQNAGEHWIPPHELNHFLGQNNQEHCTVYNMIRTADYLLKWTGNFAYADYIERNIYNGLLAQQHPQTGMVAYFLPMGAGYTKGGEKGWGHPTMDFYCCHGTLVQAQVRYLEYIYYEYDKGIAVSQYIPSELSWKKNNIPVKIEQDFLGNHYSKEYSASRWNMKFKVSAEQPVNFSIYFRVPAWLKEKAIVKLNGIPQNIQISDGGFTLTKEWNNDEVSVEFPTRLYAEPLEGAQNTVAFMEGPIVLAGMCDNDMPLSGDIKDIHSILTNEYDQEYKTVKWKQSHYRTTGQFQNIRFKPLYEVGDEKYTIYFPIKK